MELAENPSYRGVVLILILFVASNILASYVFYTKHFIQKVKPDLFEEGSDIWTENATLWESNGNCIQNSDKVYGEYSIAFSITNANELYMQIFFPESINPDHVRNAILALSHCQRYYSNAELKGNTLKAHAVLQIQ